MRDLMNLVETAESYAYYYEADEEEKYWVFPDGGADAVDNHDMWAEDNYLEWAQAAGVATEDDEDGIHDGSSCLYAGFIRVNISHYDDVGVEVNVDFIPTEATRRARSTAASYIKDYATLANQFVVGNTCYTDWRKAMRAVMTNQNLAESAFDASLGWDRKVCGFWINAETGQVVFTSGDHGETLGLHPEIFALDPEQTWLAKEFGGSPERFAYVMQFGWVRGVYTCYEREPDLSLQGQTPDHIKRAARLVAKHVPFDILYADVGSDINPSKSHVLKGPTLQAFLR